MKIQEYDNKPACRYLHGFANLVAARYIVDFPNCIRLLGCIVN